MIRKKNKDKKRLTIKKILADALIITGIAILIYLLLPYITLFIFSGRKAELNQKVQAENINEDRIIIPSLVIDAPLREGTSEKVLSSNIGIFKEGKRPGQKGNTILEGHNITEFGFLIGKNNLFSLLDLIKKKQKVYLFYDGKKFTYQVKEKMRLNVTDPSLYKQEKKEQLTLITCATTWNPSIKTNWRIKVLCMPYD